jgi:hypothetical protein
MKFDLVQSVVAVGGIALAVSFVDGCKNDSNTPSAAVAGGGGGRGPCPYAGDGVCDEPEGTAYCAEGTDPNDCAGPKGAGGAKQGASSTGGSAQASGGGLPVAVVAQVPCTKQQQPCAPSEVCCFHPQKASLDYCGSAGQCGQPYWELACNDASDCPAGTTCCNVQLDASNITFRCQASCAAPNRPICAKADDCTSNKCEPWHITYGKYLTCKD